MMVYNLKDGKKLSLRKIEEGDSAELVRLSIKMGGESDNLTFGIDDFYFTEEQQKNFISNIKDKDNCLYIAAILENKIVGTLSFVASSRKRIEHRGDMGIAILKEFWGMGIGSSLMDYFLRWAYATEVIKKVDLQVREDNIHALNLYLKWGFKIEGRITRGININGQFYDIYCMGKNIR